MKLLIAKKSGKPFPPPFSNDGKTAIAIDTIVNPQDPKHRTAYKLENGSYVNCELCIILKDFETS